jgi:hypothetical protein
LHGLKGKVKVVGMGRVSCTIFDVHGITCTIKTQAYYIPEDAIRLFSPQTYFRENGGSCEVTAENITMMISNGTKLTLPSNAMFNIPLMLTREQTTVGLTAHDVEYLSNCFNVASYLSVANEMNQNIMAEPKELLKWN